MADMPDASAYGLRPIAPNPEMMQVAPNVAGSVVPLLPAPPQVPNVSDYNIPPQAVQPQITTAMPQRGGIPTLADIVGNAEQKSGKPLTPAEFEDANQWYKTNILTPQLWNVKGANKNKVAAEVAAYDDAVKREADKRFPKQNPADQKGDASWLGSLLSSGAGQITKSASAGIGMLGGGIASAFGLAPNATADKFFAMANPDIQSTAQIDTKSLVAQRQKLLDFYANNPQAQERIKAQLDPQILAQMGLAATPNNGVEYGNAQIAAAQKTNPSAAFLGPLSGQILTYLLSPGLGAALSTTGNISSNAAQQLGEGQNLDKVLSQALVDAPLESVASLVPLGFGGGLAKRAVQGAAVNTGLNLAQQGVDTAVNNNNKISGTSVGTSAALGAILASIFGSKANTNIRDALTEKLGPSPLTKFVGNVLKGKKAGPAPAQASNTTTETPNAPKNVVDAVEADMTPKQAYTDLMNNNVTTEGLSDNEFSRLNNNIQQRAELMAKKFKPPSSFDSPDDLVAASIKYAKALTKDKFYEMTPDQREELVGSLSSWFGKRAKIDSNDISNAILGMRTIPASENATTPQSDSTVETQAPAQQNTVDQTNAQTPAQVPTQQADYTPNIKYDPLWQVASDINTPVSNLPQQMQPIASLVRSGRIPDRQTFDGILQNAEAKAKAVQAPTLKSQSKQQITGQAPEAKSATPVSDTRKVSDVLASRSTKTSEVALRKQLRMMLKASGTKDADLDKLKNSSVKNLLEKAKATRNKQALAKTNIEPIENPDEVTSKPASKNKLKKQPKTQTNASTSGEVEGSPPPKSQAPAKENVGAKNETPLEKLLQQRLGNRLPKTRLDDIHNAIETAQTGDKNDLTDLITGLQDSGDITKTEGKWLKDLPKRGVAHDLVDENSKSRAETIRGLSIGKLAKLEPQSQQESFYKRNALAWRSALLRQGVDEITANRLTSKEARELWSSNERNSNESSIQKLAADKSKEIDLDANEPIVFKKIEVRPTPLGGGVSKDGSTLYVDPAIPESINVPRSDGTIARVVLYDRNDPTVGGLAVHEGNEFPQMHERGKNYNKAHDENANNAENEYYKIKYGVSRAQVDKALKPYLDRAESESANHSDIPKDLDRTPYEQSGKAHLLDKNVENNASGESSASLEAQGRVSDERDAGRTRAVIRRNGTVEPVAHTVDAPNVHARAGEVYVQRGIGRDPEGWTILSHGDDMSRDAAMGKVNKAKQALDDTHEEMQVNRSQKEESIPENSISPEEFETLYNDRAKSESNLSQRPERIAPLSVKREVDSIVQDIREGSDVKETGSKLKELSDRIAERNLQLKLNQMHDRRRGPEWVKARLQRLVADSDPSSDHFAAAKMAQWLLDQNPNIADNMAIAIRSMESGEAGRFNPISRLLQLNANDLNKTTGLHELLHASERLLPTEIQDKIRGEYIGRVQNKLKKTTDQWARAYLKNAIRNFVHPNKSDQLAMTDILKNHRYEVPAGDFYKYFDTSEYWAEEGSNILARRYAADSWIGKAKQWLSEFGEHIKSVFGLDNNSQVIKGLNKMLKATEGESGMLNKGDQEAKAIKEDSSKDYDAEQVGDEPTDKELGYETDKAADVDPNMQKEVVYNKGAKDLGNYTESDKIIEALANSDHGLEKAVQFAHRENIPIDENNNVFDAAYEKRGITSHTKETDRLEVVNAADDWVHQNYSKFANSTAEAYDRINDFYGAKEMLDRAETAWYMESPLDGTAEIDRGVILEKLNDGDITPDKARSQLRKLAKDHSILDWQQYAESKGTDVEALEKILKDLKNKGVDENSLAEHNKLTQAIRDRLERNLIKSGDVAKIDPYVKLYDHKWWVPLKGSPFGGKVDANFDLIPDKNIALARLNKQMALMKGRNSLADKPYFRLMVDLARSADRIGHKVVMDRLYNLLTTEGPDGKLALKKFGAKIDVFHGFQKKGYTDSKGKQVDRLKAPANGVIINDGDTHYVVTLPHNSELLRGLIQMDNIKAPKNRYNRGAGKITNTLARLYTTINPSWVASVGFARDITYVPFSIAATRFDNPLQAIPFILRYIPEILGAYKSLPTIIPQIVGNEAALRAAAAANPESWAAKTLRYKAAGGANYFTRSFDITGVEKELLSRYTDTNGVIDASKYGVKKILDYTGNFANSLELLTRVAMFNQLVKEGMSDTAAGVQVRKIMDYEQSGTNGRLINSWLAFFRVGATGTDVIRRAFTKKTGGLDYPKFAKWQLFMGSLGYLSYMAAMQLLGKDTDGKYKIQKINPNQLTSKAFFPVGDKIGSLNLGLGIPQFMLAPGILAAALEQGHIDQRTALKAYLDMLERNGPTSPGGALGDTPADYMASAFFGFVPTAIRPIIDTSRNTSSFSSPIHTSDPDRNKFSSDQGYPNTASAYKDIATWVREHSGGTIDLFPEDVKYWIDSYGGSPATDFTKWAFESGDVKAGGQPPMGRLAGRFFVDTSHYMSRDMFDALDTLAESSKRYNHLVSTAMHSDGLSRDQAKAQVSEVTNRDSSFAARLEAYKELLKAHKDYNAQVNSLRDNKLLSDTRKQLVRKQADSQLRKAIEKAQTVIDKTSN